MSESLLGLSWIAREQDLVETSDPLALQGETDRIAESLLPGLSVVTYRARYYSFFCWARGHKRYDPGRIHRLEEQLARQERDYHLHKSKDLCSFHGKRVAMRGGGRRARILAVSSWERGYRASCAALGLIEDAPPYRLTERGDVLARLYGKASRQFTSRDGAALCAISPAESQELRKILGFDQRLRSPEQSDSAVDAALGERVGTWRALCTKYKKWLPEPHEILASFAHRAGSTMQGKLLRHAAGWSHIATGLSAIFYSYVQHGRSRILAGKFMRTMRSCRRITRPLDNRRLAATDLMSLTSVLSVALGDLYQGLAILAVSQKDGFACDVDILALAKELLAGDRIRAVHAMLQRHLQFRPDDPWLDSDCERVVVGEDRIPRAVRVASVRLRVLLALREDVQ